ncbi:thioredoxin family protein [Sphaerospermopsis aphanizomenoides BCCUSP55]|uniref:thioredoxin family protein n=1 Tax=Sphaerospermopsis aphanizomenoides TaxID=459663 RepID=UPI001904B560|nr:thioredoxin family protein [Sphaerospermopsis aphanizomenoides]MBK1988087.1 thioredoxin family protein [Sphaerospermopsis aphanizomenoides BCCUSP55]
MIILETIDTPIGSYAPDFELPGIDDHVHHLSRYRENLRALCVISMSNHCPYVDLYLERLKNIQTEFSPNGFTLIGLNGTDGNNDMNAEAEFSTKLTFENMKTFALHHQLNFPYLWDSTQDVTRSFGAISTPTAYLIDHEGILRYKGQIDDHPTDPLIKGVDYLKNAIASLFQGQEIQPEQTQQAGTPLIWRK